MMKPKTLLLAFFFLTVYTLHAQEKKGLKRTIGITLSGLGTNDVISDPDMIGGPAYDGKGFYAVGVSYVHPVLNWFDIEAGAEFSRHTITTLPNLPPNMEDKAPYNTNVSLVSFPIGIRINFLNYFFVNGGGLLDFDTSTGSHVDSQSGIGAFVGLGVKYRLNNGFGVFINAYSKSHSLIATFRGSNKNDELLEAGFRLGLNYSF